MADQQHSRPHFTHLPLDRRNGASSREVLVQIPSWDSSLSALSEVMYDSTSPGYSGSRSLRNGETSREVIGQSTPNRKGDTFLLHKGIQAQEALRKGASSHEVIDEIPSYAFSQRAPAKKGCTFSLDQSTPAQETLQL